jgi:hypothetical protein
MFHPKMAIITGSGGKQAKQSRGVRCTIMNFHTSNLLMRSLYWMVNKWQISIILLVLLRLKREGGMIKWFYLCLFVQTDFLLSWMKIHNGLHFTTKHKFIILYLLLAHRYTKQRTEHITQSILKGIYFHLIDQNQLHKLSLSYIRSDEILTAVHMKNFIYREKPPCSQEEWKQHFGAAQPFYL